MANRLADSLSPYLRQHADNPVDWREWSPDALQDAVDGNRPILLSVGYAACHWCHVMAHESFEDAEVAAAINDSFVAIKVDREERPDIDAAYMTATTAMTGSGGWPMTCLLTPDGKPFFAGTYLPKPQFLQLLSAAKHAWETQPDEVRASGDNVATQLAAAATRGTPNALTPELTAAAVTTLRQSYDVRYGGFGGAPKFPPSMVLEFLLRHHARTGDSDALAMVDHTCKAMARGGIYDQLAGGFARYSVDATWTVPHFEKMLYDNAQLLRVYAHLWRVDQSPLIARIIAETAEFIIRDLGTAEGGFASALDADTEGTEGTTYVWSVDDLREALGEEDARWAAELLAVTGEGTFEHGTSTLQLTHDPDDPARWKSIRAKLMDRRAQRAQPDRDAKVVTSWNGLAISALAEAAMILQESEWLDAARSSADFLLGRHLVDSRLRRTSLGGRVSNAPGVADDYGNFAEGLLVLHQATGERGYLTAGEQLLATAQDVFTGPSGSFHDAAADSEKLFFTPRGSGDNAEPSGTSSIASALLTLSALTGDPAARDRAEAALAAMGEIATQAPRFAGWGLAVAEAALAGPVQVAVVGEDRAARGLSRTAWAAPTAGGVIVHGAPDAPTSPLLADRPLIDDRSAAYVCHGFVCQAPVSDRGELIDQLRGH